MGNVGGPRHFTAATPAAASWRCPSCQTVNTSRFEDGCPACGAGTPAMNEAAQQKVSEPINLVSLVLGNAVAGMKDSTIVAFTKLAPYTLEARQTIAAALAFAADNGMVAPEGGLSQRAMVEWARVIVAVEDDNG